MDRTRIRRSIYLRAARANNRAIGARPLERTRILLVEMPQMLRDIVAGVLADEPDMEIVGEEWAMNGLPETVVEAGADVVVIGRDDPSLARMLLERAPRLRVLGVTTGGHDSWLYELLPHRVPLGEISPKRLVEEIRKSAGDGAEWWAR